jgi:hypothetical protein
MLSLDAPGVLSDDDGGRVVPLGERIPDRSRDVLEIVLLRERFAEAALAQRQLRADRGEEFTNGGAQSQNPPLRQDHCVDSSLRYRDRWSGHGSTEAQSKSSVVPHARPLPRGRGLKAQTRDLLKQANLQGKIRAPSQSTPSLAWRSKSSFRFSPI